MYRTGDDFQTSRLIHPPALEHLVASTMSLITCWVGYAATQDEDLPTHCPPSFMARKITSNLFLLKNHPDASAELRQSMAHVHERWALLTRADTQIRNLMH